MSEPLEGLKHVGYFCDHADHATVHMKSKWSRKRESYKLVEWPGTISAWMGFPLPGEPMCPHAQPTFVQTTEPRVLEGDWETVRDALDALPEGAQIRWRTGDPIHVALAIKYANVMGKGRWDTTGFGLLLSSDNIARDETPIEVIA
jgi:hypothetical protein